MAHEARTRAFDAAVRRVRWAISKVAGIGFSYAMRQWPLLLCLVLGTAMLVSSLCIKLVDLPDGQGVDEKRISQVGVYTELPMDSVIDYSAGIERFQQNWSLTASPGQPWQGRLEWIGITSEVSEVRLENQIPILISLPRGARIKEDKTNRIGHDDSCASWSAGQAVKSVQPEISVSESTGEILLGCTIPAIGKVENLFVEVSFEWDSDSRSSSGIGRSRDAVRFPVQATVPTDALESMSGPVRDLDGTIRQPFDFRLTLPRDQRLIDSFPGPDGGTIGQRTWSFAAGDNLSRKDIEFTTQTESIRAWVAPVTDTLLLLGGLILGYAPSASRKDP